MGAPTTTSVAAESAVLENAFLKVALDRGKGGIVSIVDKQAGRELVDPKAKYAFGQYLYQRFDRKQTFAYDVGCEHIDSIYGFATGWNVRADVPAGVPYTEAAPTYAGMTVCKGGLVQTAQLIAEPASIIAAQVTTTIRLPENAPWLEISIRLDDKKPDYWPENGGFYLPVEAARPQFRVGRLGGLVNPVTDYARGSNRTYAYVDTGAMIADADGAGIGICPLDHGIMSFGEKGICTIDPDYLPKAPVAMVSMFNNLWTINFPYWIQGTIQSRIRVWAIHGLNPSSLVEPAWEARQPVLAAVAVGPAGKLPATASGLAISRPGVRLVQFAPNPDGAGTVLRIWEQGGIAGQVSVTLPAQRPFRECLPVNLRGEPIAAPIQIANGRFSFHLGAYAPAGFVLTPELPAAVIPPGNLETVKP